MPPSSLAMALQSSVPLSRMRDAALVAFKVVVFIERADVVFADQVDVVLLPKGIVMVSLCPMTPGKMPARLKAAILNVTEVNKILFAILNGDVSELY